MPYDSDSVMHYAYTHLKVATTDDAARIIKGMATTPTPDRLGDIVEPLGAKIGPNIKLLWQHDMASPVGTVKFGRPTKKGIPFTAQIKKAKDDYPASMKDLLQKAWVSVRDGLVDAVSIGFGIIDLELMEGGGFRIKEWEMRELSLVTIPANPDASIDEIRSADRELRAALGINAQINVQPTGRDRPRSNGNKGNANMTNFSKNLSALEADRTNIVKAMNAFDQSNMDETDEERFAELAGQLKSVKKQISRTKLLEEANITDVEFEPATKNVPAVVEKKPERLTPYGENKHLGPNKNIPEGIAFTRWVMCLGKAKGIEDVAMKIAEREYPDHEAVRFFGMHQDKAATGESLTKAAVPAAYTGDDAGWAETIAEAQTVSNDFIEFLRPNNVFDQLAPLMRRANFNTKTSRLATGQSAYWVGEALPAPLTSGVFDTVTLPITKIASISVISKEQIQFSNINAQMAIRDDLAASANAQLNTKAFSTDAAVANVSPAGLLEGLSAISSAGDTADNARTDLVNLFEPFSAANIGGGGMAYVTTENIGKALRVMKSSLGVYEFPEAREGNLDDAPLRRSNHVGGGDLIAMHCPSILLADEGQVSVEFSDQASLEMLDGSLVQNATDGTGASLVNLWQSGLVGIKVERFIGWAKARAEAVAYIGDATYQGASA